MYAIGQQTKILEQMNTQELLQVKIQMAQLVDNYKSYEDLTPDNPPKIIVGSYWSPRYGFIRMCENVIAYDFSFPRKLIIGIEIGSKFAGGDSTIINQVRTDAKNILRNFAFNHKGYILDNYGSAYYQVGYYKE